MIKGRQSSASGGGRKTGKSGKPPKTPRPTFSIISLFATDRNKKKGKASLPPTPAYANVDGGGAAAASGAFGEPGQSAVSYDESKLDGVGGGETSKGKLKECPLCFEEQPVENFCNLATCSHRSCITCLRQYLKIEIAESRVSISCPECSELLHPSDIKRLLRNDLLMDKWEKFMLRRVLVSDPDARWCPAPDCGYAVIATGCAGCPKLQCHRPGCDTFFCYHCKQEWHPSQTCDAARLQRTANLRAAITSFSVDALMPEPREEIKFCPRCKSYITKLDDGSCNHMTCTLCGAQFCWLCNKEITDLHYLSPSGCTFWGKKPWSRKKKILWQLGTLLGAPVGIALLASLAVPVIVVAFPIYAGKWLYQRHKNKSRARRNAIVVAGVAGAFVLSPLVAALAVAIGVPVMLTYVYGVVPISLCRGANGNGHQSAAPATSSVSVRFDFEDDVAAESGTQVSVPNPSIAPSIGEASLWAANSYSASITQIDDAGCARDGRPVAISDEQSDVESASQKVMVGPSLNSSLYDAESAAGHNRLEIHADIAPRHIHRSSFSSESTSVCVSMADSKSVALSTVTGDSISVKALAGSLMTLREKDGSVFLSTCPSIDQGTINDDEGKARCTYDHNPTSTDAPKYKCRSSSHGSPVSNRSVTFAPALEEHLMARHSSIKLGKRREKVTEKSIVEQSTAVHNGSPFSPQCDLVPPAEGEVSHASAPLHMHKPECVNGAGDWCTDPSTSNNLHSDSCCCRVTAVTAMSTSCCNRDAQGMVELPIDTAPMPYLRNYGSRCNDHSDMHVDSRLTDRPDVSAAIVIKATPPPNCEGFFACEAGFRAESSRLWRRMSCEMAMENGLPADIV